MAKRVASTETTVAGAAAGEASTPSAGAAAAGGTTTAQVVPGAVEMGSRARWWRRTGTKSRGFRYEDARGRRVTDEAALARIKSLAIPPAWRHVRVAPGARCRVQAIGVDKLGRVQRIYDPQFVARRQREKFDKIVRFGEALPNLRRKTNEDIAREGLPRERVLAVVIRLINELHFRVGSEESVKKYRTYGVTTLRNRHLEIAPGGRLVFSFTGKHHIKHRRVLVDEELAALTGDIQRLKGSRLFHFYDEEQKRVRPVSPRDVNDYIKAATSAEFSAKDFRTWGGTLRVATVLADLGPAATDREAASNVALAVRLVAAELGNTPAICRKSYVHPMVIARYLDEGATIEPFLRHGDGAHSPAQERRAPRPTA
ncbi:MAG TPA: hypothetical protein VM864_05550, partial [Pyrinomonadaceae bacterium]|nr:hypothetical protein [Pyrinomonadaceae bacterium]